MKYFFVSRSFDSISKHAELLTKTSTNYFVSTVFTNCLRFMIHTIWKLYKRPTERNVSESMSLKTRATY